MECLPWGAKLGSAAMRTALTALFSLAAGSGTLSALAPAAKVAASRTGEATASIAERIATEVYVATKGRVELSDETLRTWFPQFAAVAVAGAPEDAA